MTDTPLLDWEPPTPKGETFDEARDGHRLAAQAKRVLDFCRSVDGWVSLAEISDFTRDPEASVSARLRDLRRAGFVVERKFIARGLHHYRITEAPY